MANPKIYQVANLQSQLSSANNNANNRVLKTGDTMTGNLTFSGTGLRILGDMSNATLANRLMFQNSVANGASQINVLPNGTSQTSLIRLINNSDPANAGTTLLYIDSGESSVRADRTGTGTYLPMTFHTGGSERMRLDTNGNIGIGGTPASNDKVLITGTLPTTANSTRVIPVRGTIPSTALQDCFVFESNPSTQAATFTLNNIQHFRAGGVTLGANSAIGIQYGFIVPSVFAVANATNYGFFSNIASGENRWNFYAQGTANNHFSGSVGIGTTTPESKLHVAGSFRQTAATVPFEWTANAGAVDFYKLNAVGYADNLIVLNGAGRVGFGTTNPSTAGRVTVANNMGMVIAHETAGIDLRIGFGNLTGNSNSHTGTALGYRALNNSTVLTYSVAIGYDALETCTTGQENNAIGYYALKRLTTGRDNVGIGAYAAQSLTTGRYNVAVGRAALNTANTSDYNTAVGYQAMYYTTTGYQNSAYGSLCMQDNTIGYLNSAFGTSSLRTNTTGYVNDAFGVNTLFNNTTGIENKAFGYQALYYNTTGSYNVGIGSNALVYNTTSSYNTMVGNYSGYGVLNTPSNGYNAALGYATLYAMRGAAQFNTAIGNFALNNLTTSLYNTAVGYYAGQQITTGGYNTLIGNQAGYYGTSLTTGDNNVMIGSFTRGVSATTTHEIVIGYDLAGVGANYVTIGKAGSYIYNQFTVNSTWTQTSDLRLKKNIQNDSLGLSFINRLRPVTYNWKASNELDPTNPLYKTENDRDTATVMHGLIAQEVKAAMEAEGCNTFGGWDEKNGIQSISREQFISPLINAVKELSAKIALLEAEIKTLKGE